MKIFVTLFAFAFASVAYAGQVSGVRLSKQAKAVVANDVCGEAVVTSVRDYITRLNEDAGVDIPDGGYPTPYIKQILTPEDLGQKRMFSVLVTNYDLPTLNVRVTLKSGKCTAYVPTVPRFGAE